MKKLCIFFLMTCLCATLSAADEARDAALARIAIMNFTNATQSQNYEWVEKSLPDAINESMRERFEFTRQDAGQVNAIATQYQQVAGEYTSKDSLKIAKESKSDMLIYGSFRLNETGDQLIIQAIIYNAAGKRVIGIVQDASSVDTKLFQAISRIAAGIVDKIYTFALAAEREKGAPPDLKILVLVPSFTNAAEEKAAIKELDVLKGELSETYKGRYMTIYEFFEEGHVPKAEQDKVLGFAKRRERDEVIAWLAGFGVKNAFIVLVSDKKVNITPVTQGKTAQTVTYAVNAKPNVKRASIAVASKEVSAKAEKIEIKKETLTVSSVTMLQVGLLGGQGILDAGNKLGPLLGLNVQFGMRLWSRWFEPQIKIEGYYGLKKGGVESMTGANLAAGLGHTFLFSNSKMALTPYVLGGIMVGSIKNTVASINFLIPSVSVGLNYAIFLSPNWGISLNGNANYAIDKVSPGLFFTGSLAWIYRF